jgi:hypothetical protein
MGMKQGLNPNRDHEQGVGNGKVRSSWNVKVEVKGKGWDDVHRVSLFQFVALRSVRYLAHVVESVYRGLLKIVERESIGLNPAGGSDRFWECHLRLRYVFFDAIQSYLILLVLLSSGTVGGVLLTMY